jgi:antibiotic biosynthesis monooxygenase (ABM) superfamily enzyme
LAESEGHGGTGPLRGPVPRYKIAVITWLAIYPALTVTLALLSPVLAPLPLFLRTLILTAVLVPIMVYVLVPAVHRLLAGWLSSGVSPNRSGR